MFDEEKELSLTEKEADIIIFLKNSKNLYLLMNYKLMYGDIVQNWKLIL